MTRSLANAELFYFLLSQGVHVVWQRLSRTAQPATGLLQKCYCHVNVQNADLLCEKEEGEEGGEEEAEEEEEEKEIEEKECTEEVRQSR